MNVQHFDIGVVLAADLVGEDGTALPLAGLTLEVLLQPPKGPARVRAGIAGAAEGRVEYTTEAGDLDQFGRWCFQVHVYGGGIDKHSALGVFTVERNIDPPNRFLRLEPAQVVASARAPDTV